jgi:hypothetical protein
MRKHYPLGPYSRPMPMGLTMTLGGGDRGTSLFRSPPPSEPTKGLCLRPCGDPRGGGVSYERGTPIRTHPHEANRCDFIKPTTDCEISLSGCVLYWTLPTRLPNATKLACILNLIQTLPTFGLLVQGFRVWSHCLLTYLLFCMYFGWCLF